MTLVDHPVWLPRTLTNVLIGRALPPCRIVLLSPSISNVGGAFFYCREKAGLFALLINLTYLDVLAVLAVLNDHSPTGDTTEQKPYQNANNEASNCAHCHHAVSFPLMDFASKSAKFCGRPTVIFPVKLDSLIASSKIGYILPYSRISRGCRISTLHIFQNLDGLEEAALLVAW